MIQPKLIQHKQMNKQTNKQTKKTSKQAKIKKKTRQTSIVISNSWVQYLRHNLPSIKRILHRILLIFATVTVILHTYVHAQKYLVKGHLANSLTAVQALHWSKPQSKSQSTVKGQSFICCLLSVCNKDQDFCLAKSVLDF